MAEADPEIVVDVEEWQPLAVGAESPVNAGGRGAYSVLRGEGSGPPQHDPDGPPVDPDSLQLGGYGESVIRFDPSAPDGGFQPPAVQLREAAPMSLAPAAAPSAPSMPPATTVVAVPAGTHGTDLEVALRKVATTHAAEIQALYGTTPETTDLARLVLWVLVHPARAEEVLREGFAGELLRRAARADEQRIVEDHGGRPVASLSETEIALWMAEQRGAGKLGEDATRALDAYRQAARKR